MKIWGLLETEYHKLDLQLDAQHTQGKTRDRDSFVKYAKLLHDMEKLHEEHRHHSNLAAMLDSIVTAPGLQIIDDEKQKQN